MESRRAVAAGTFILAERKILGTVAVILMISINSRSRI